MSDGTTILAYSRYFLSYLWLCLTRARKTKIVKYDLATGFIEGISTIDISIWSVSARVISVEMISATSAST